MVSPRADPFRAVALVPDMLTSVRIENAVRRAGGALDVVDSNFELLKALADRPAFAVIDLSLSWLDIDAVAERCQKAGVPLLAFGPHVDVAGLRRARTAGVDFVYPRSKLLADLNGIVADVLASGEPSRAAN